MVALHSLCGTTCGEFVVCCFNKACSIIINYYNPFNIKSMCMTNKKILATFQCNTIVSFYIPTAPNKSSLNQLLLVSI